MVETPVQQDRKIELIDDNIAAYRSYFMKPARWLMAKTYVVMDLLITDLWRPTDRNR